MLSTSGIKKAIAIVIVSVILLTGLMLLSCDKYIRTQETFTATVTDIVFSEGQSHYVVYFDNGRILKKDSYHATVIKYIIGHTYQVTLFYEDGFWSGTEAIDVTFQD